MKKLGLFVLSVSLFGLLPIHAEGGLNTSRAKNHNLYFHIDFGSGNIYPTVISMATGYFNYLLDRPIFETSYNYSFITAKYGNEKLDTKHYDFNGLTARDLFNDIEAGIKLGYQTYTPDLFNVGIYGSVHYKLDQFMVKGYNESDYQSQNIHRVLLGATAFTTIGKMDNALKVTLEAGCRYNIGCLYKVNSVKMDDALNNGLSSHFAIKFAGEEIYQNIAIFANFNHFNLLKAPINGVDKINMWSIGITWSLTPVQIDSKYY